MTVPDLPTDYWRAANSMCRRWKEYHHGHAGHPDLALPWRHAEGVVVGKASTTLPWFVSQRKAACKVHAVKWCVVLWGRSGPVLAVKGYCSQLVSHPRLLGSEADWPVGFTACPACALGSGHARICMNLDSLSSET